ncbi:MAG: UPF0280 family protein [Chloroflexi bacterium]|nr:UPF0280 family protein [Chloroflexota bacterium]
MYEERRYRQFSHSEGLSSFIIRVKETDLFISVGRDLSTKVRSLVTKLRTDIENYIIIYPDFATSLVPLPLDYAAPAIVRQMLKAGKKAGVGPMAAVAGAIAQAVAVSLHKESADVLVENGGDVFMYSMRDRVLGIWAGENSSFNKYGLKIKAADTPVSICCSSGKVGHSLSFGLADVAIVIAKNGALADACATALGNRISVKEDLQAAINYIQNIKGVLGVVAIIGQDMAVWGQVELLLI